MNNREQLISLTNGEFVNQIPGFFGILSLESKFILVNKTGAQWTGFESEEEMIGLSYENIRCKAAEDSELFIEQDKILRSRDRFKMIGFYCYAGNEWRIIIGEKYLLRNIKNEMIGLVSRFDDFTRSNLIDISRFLVDSANKYCSKKSKQFCYYIEDVYPDASLSQRLSECLFLLLRGKSSKSIAAILNLSPRTIEHYIEELKFKLNCTTKQALIEKLIANGYMNILPERFINFTYFDT